MSGAALAAAAEALIGCPFRLHGRDPQRGLDCVGLVASALAATGHIVSAPAGYAMRRQEVGALAAIARGAGLVEVEGPVSDGDVLLVRCGPGQLHLIVATSDGGFVHAHAGIGRVARTPGPLPGPVERHWRLLSR